MLNELINEARPKMQKTLEHLSGELNSIRTGRASTSLVENLTITVYEQEMTIKQVANISTPDAKSIAISPWDPSNTAAIEKAIRDESKLDLNPVSDGKNIHINIPPLTQESRELIAKQVNEKVEQALIALRNIRHEVLNEAKRMQLAKDIGEDEYHRAEKQVTEELDKTRAEIEAAAEQKRQEILTI